jgi:hypothetical protein
MKNAFNPILGSVCLVLLAAISAEAKEWRGIVPLHSTRNDVERILGASKDPCKCIYKTENEVVTIDYARHSCLQNPDGWNVPSDTVLTITVSLRTSARFSDLNIDTRSYKQTKDLHTDAIYYSDEEEGVTYQVSEDGMVAVTVYGPSSSDSNLRCRELASEGFAPVFDHYGEIAFSDEKARLDNFAAQLIYFSESVGYIVIYPGFRGSSAKALSRARQARRYLVRIRGVKADRITIIQGGRKDTLTTELYILPKSSPAPRPDPSSGRR